VVSAPPVAERLREERATADNGAGIELLETIERIRRSRGRTANDLPVGLQIPSSARRAVLETG